MHGNIILSIFVCIKMGIDHQFIKKFLVVVGLVVVMVLNLHDHNEVIAIPQIPCCFIFGDSLVDNGNNNFIASFAKANYFPYGIDFPGGPSGRFTNGKTVVDVIAQLMGSNGYIPSYTSAAGQEIFKGVNYASAAGGIRDETGYQLGARSSFTMQVNNYKNTVSQMVDLLGGENSTANYLSKCIYSIGLGSNDYLNNYFMPFFYSTSSQYSPQQYATVLIQQYSQLLRTLNNFGARKFVLSALGPIGCVPNILVRNSPDGKTCVAKINNAVQIFNGKLKSLVDILNKQQKDSTFIYIDTYGIFQDIMRNSSLGFRVTNAACCGVGKNNALITCLPFQTPCSNRKEYLFWDSFHPTEAVNIIVGRRAYDVQKGSKDVHPMDIRGLAKL